MLNPSKRHEVLDPGEEQEAYQVSSSPVELSFARRDFKLPPVSTPRDKRECKRNPIVSVIGCVRISQNGVQQVVHEFDKTKDAQDMRACV